MSEQCACKGVGSATWGPSPYALQGTYHSPFGCLRFATRVNLRVAFAELTGCYPQTLWESSVFQALMFHLARSPSALPHLSVTLPNPSPGALYGPLGSVNPPPQG